MTGTHSTFNKVRHEIKHQAPWSIQKRSRIHTLGISYLMSKTFIIQHWTFSTASVSLQLYSCSATNAIKLKIYFFKFSPIFTPQSSRASAVSLPNSWGSTACSEERAISSLTHGWSQTQAPPTPPTPRKKKRWSQSITVSWTPWVQT